MESTFIGGGVHRVSLGDGCRALLYEGCDTGCDEQLRDGSVCRLGTKARHVGSCEGLAFGRIQGIALCQKVGEGRLMFCFMIDTSQGEYQVWDEAAPDRLDESL